MYRHNAEVPRYHRKILLPFITHLHQLFRAAGHPIDCWFWFIGLFPSCFQGVCQSIGVKNFLWLIPHPVIVRVMVVYNRACFICLERLRMLNIIMPFKWTVLHVSLLNVLFELSLEPSRILIWFLRLILPFLLLWPWHGRLWLLWLKLHLLIFKIKVDGRVLLIKITVVDMQYWVDIIIRFFIILLLGGHVPISALIHLRVGGYDVHGPCF